MDKQYSVKFFTSFVEAMQKLCREYLDFEQGVELSGYLAVEIDNYKKERYVLSELVQSTGNVISESYCTKAFKTLRKEPQRVAHGSENIAPRDHTNRSNRSHSEEVTMVLRDSPETVPRHSASGFPLHTTPHRSSSHRHSFHPSQRAHASSRHKDGAASSGSSPFDVSQSSRGQQQPYEIQPRCSESLQNMPDLSPKTITSHKRSIVDVECSNLGPTVKKDKIDLVGSNIDSLLENVSDTQADVESMQNIYSSVAASTTTTSASDTLHTTLDGSSQPAGDESIRLRAGIDIKRERDDDDDAFMIIENPNDPTVKLLEAEGVFGGERENAQTLGLDTSTSFSADSQNVDHADFKDSGSGGEMAGTSWESSNQQSLRREPGTDKISPRSSGIHMCNICNKTFTFNWTLVRHKQSVHQKLYKYRCDLCWRYFSRKDHLASHLSVHSKRDKLIHFPC